MSRRAARGVVAMICAGVMAAACILPAAAAQTFPPRAYRDARLKSEFHIQIAVEQVRPPTPTPGLCLVTGKIERVFRGNVSIDTPIELELDCKKETDKVRPGQTLWADVDQLAAAKHIEAFVNRGPYGFQHSLWQFLIIPAPTDKPVIDPHLGVP